MATIGFFCKPEIRPFICWQSKRRSVNSRPMPDKLVTRGLVLRATETKEADYILTVLTAEHGRLAVIARGARRRSSKRAAAGQHLAFSELVLYRRGSWYYLDEASTIARLDGLRADL